ncbi:hypothetical protein COT99_04420 [Candidatus Falkowbacteria bacterium CG10_big_fil_rev_8_21_14_0_10_43_10]|uniref:Uncharacterized protein n=1 Tax=Candidatus Falkowbacteria bacterium CG10_big_fil_rev_8_21_14_0_10_43_10 TaxID=1974567 RepID=A0A2H0V124_9BACT|nr:MAG: hypothetical protein COT99_04420 [Candidatus Falkowbacteria bacterium CG10_big_fil_rev_8_21_14_0_10_43_10]
MEEKNNNINEDLLVNIPDEYVSGGEYREKLDGFKPRRPEAVTWKQKITVVFLILFGVSAMILWGIQFKNSLQTGRTVSSDKSASLNSETRTQEQSKDSDEDGLSDYDELYVHKTSIYLEDTDSDGLGDREELEMGEDPNCPLGQNCFSESEAGGSGSTENTQPEEPVSNPETSPSPQNLTPEEGSGAVSQDDSERQLIESILLGEADAASLRKLLLQAGMDEESLNRISDEQLLNTYKNTLQTQK